MSSSPPPTHTHNFADIEAIIPVTTTPTKLIAVKRHSISAKRKRGTQECLNQRTLTNQFSRPPDYLYENVRRWIRHEKDLSQLNKVFFPVNVGNYHWCLIVAYMEEKKIICFDSMENGRSRRAYIELVIAFLEDESVGLNQDSRFPKVPFDFCVNEWVIEERAECPRQLNDYDCGIFMLTFIDLISLDLPLLFKQSDVTHIRRRMLQEIIDFCKLSANGDIVPHVTPVVSRLDTTELGD
jgi:hypothetical protein